MLKYRLKYTDLSQTQFGTQKQCHDKVLGKTPVSRSTRFAIKKLLISESNVTAKRKKTDGYDLT